MRGVRLPPRAKARAGPRRSAPRAGPGAQARLLRRVTRGTPGASSRFVLAPFLPHPTMASSLCVMRYPPRLALPALTLSALVTHVPAFAAEPPVTLAQVVVTPSKFGVAEERTHVGATLTGAELETLPQVGDDLFRSIARLPGLAADDFTARFWVRGAPNGQLLARLDGVDLIEPFHLKDVDGALSIVDPQTISRLDLTTGGFTAEFGNHLAGVLVMETKSASTAHTALGLSLTGIGGSNQGVWANRQGRWLASVRRGYPDVALRAAGRDDDVTPRYYDVSAQVEYQVAPGHTVSLHALHAGDTLTYQRTNNPSLESSYDSDYVWGRWLGGFGSELKSEAVLSYSRLGWNRRGFGLLDGFPFSLRDRRRLTVLGARNDWSLALGDRALVRAGVEAKSGDSRYDYALSRQHTVVSEGRQIIVTESVNAALRPDGDSFGAFVSARLQPFAALVVEPGLRFDRQNFTSDSQGSPRLNAALTLGRATVRAAWGAYRQPQALHELAVADGDTTFRRAELAEHRILGVEYPLARGVNLRVEAYERLTSRLRPRWENLDNGYDLFPEAQSDRARLDPKRARARGIEFLLAGRTGPRLTWNASYALARTEELLAGRWTPRSRDQRHTLYADVTYAPNPRWQFSTSWQFHTGWPATDIVYSLATLTNGRRVLVSANTVPYNLRLPDYHRLDLRATRRFKLSRGELRVFIDVFNAYDRTNYVSYDHRVTVTGTQITDVRKPRDQLPLLPSAGVSWEF